VNQVNRHPDAAELAQLAANLRILLLDVDGVLTDGGIILIGGDLEAKRFDVQDGMGIGMLRAAGVMIGIVTSRTSQVVQRRAEELNIEELFQGVRHKPDVLDSILEKYGIEPSQAGFVGDDLQDIPLMRQIGLPIAVRNARPEVKENCVYVTQNPGGHGAVREIAEWLLELRGDKERVIQSITGLDTVAQH
jgi:3-deoxy-D-manno-octulosonate 8-phosphate phosphatase (KDO 8-P phosphatase)